MDLTSLLLNGAGGAILGPLISQFLGGKSRGLITRIIAGIVGGVGAGQAANSAGINLPAILGDPQMQAMIQSVIEGGVGGGVLSSLARFMPAKK
ncbi:MAG: hypothetical protein K2Q06_12600 [Parvularculaceae bacterium]|nr:hypothetical protein [Parvularculaceae bacterium]